jgi:hypothetical protein
MIGRIDVEHDARNDLYVVTPHWQIETHDDCVAWAKQYESIFEPLGCRVDVILRLDDFHIGGRIGPVWGRFRADMVRRYFRHSVRVSSDAKVSAFAATSFALHQAANDAARDVPAAVELIKRLRAADGTALRPVPRSTRPIG